MSATSPAPAVSIVDQFDDGEDDDCVVKISFSDRDSAREFVERLIMLGVIAPAPGSTN